MAITHQTATSFEYTQVEASTSWTVVHNLGLYPSVDVFVTYNGVSQKIIPASVTYTDANTCVIGFSVARSGTAVVA